MVRSVLFDIDGTLIRTGGAGQQAFAKACASAFNIPNGAERLSFAGRTDMGIVRSFFENHQIEPSAENFRKFFDSYVQWLGQALADNQGCVLPGIHRWLEELKALDRPPVVGLLTGNIQLGAQIKLGYYGLWHCFELGAYGDDHEDRNEVALLARRRAGQYLGEPLEGDQIVVVGDTPLDIACAQAIGAHVLAVATGSYSREELRKHEPTWLVEDMEQISVSEVMEV